MSMPLTGLKFSSTHTKDLGQVLGAIHQAASKIGGAIGIPNAIEARGEQDAPSADLCLCRVPAGGRSRSATSHGQAD